VSDGDYFYFIGAFLIIRFCMMLSMYTTTTVCFNSSSNWLFMLTDLPFLVVALTSVCQTASLAKKTLQPEFSSAAIKEKGDRYVLQRAVTKAAENGVECFCFYFESFELLANVHQ